MADTYFWNIVCDLDRLDLRLPFINFFGGHEVNTSLYYHDLTVRTDLPHMLFQYTLSGEGRFRHKGKEYRVLPGQGFLCNAHDPDIAYYYPPDGSDTYELFYCCFGGDMATIQEIADIYGPVFEVDRESLCMTQFLNYQVRKRYSRSVKMSQSQSVQMANNLLAELIKSGEKGKESEQRIILSQKVEMYLREHIEEKVSVEELATLFGFSTGHFSRQFKKERGVTPQSFVDSLRMKHALKLIKSTRLTIKEVAFRMNYDTPAHFNRAFKRVNGVTPGSLRRS